MKKNYKTIFLLILNSAFLIFDCYSQQITFQKTYGNTFTDYAQSISKTNDGGYIITGLSKKAAAGMNFDILLIKINASGDTLWTYTYGGSGDDRGFSVVQTNDGGYIIAGYTTSFATDNTFLMKTDSAGISQWINTYGLQSVNYYSVKQTPDGGYIFAGVTPTNSAGSYDICLLKTNSAGISQWLKLYGTPQPDLAYSIEFTNDGGYIISGSSNTSAANDDVLVLKTDSSGNMAWAKMYGGSGNERAYSARQTADGGYIISGATGSFGYGIYLIKTDSAGNHLWSKAYSPGGGFNPPYYEVKQIADGGYIIGGGGTYNIYLLKTDTAGNAEWMKRYRNNQPFYYNVANDLEFTNDGGYMLAGFTDYNNGPSSYNCYLIKTDSLGNSGCNDTSITPTATICATQVNIPSLIINSFSANDTLREVTIESGFTITTECFSVGIPNLQSSTFNFQLTPNPLTTQSKLTFKNPNKEKFLFSLYDITGRVTESVSITNNEIILTKGCKQAGVYLFNLVNEKTGERENGKIVIQ